MAARWSWGDGRPPVLTFDEHGYGGYAGCNAFGGQEVAHEGRFYGGFALSTAMACGAPLDEQETGVQRLLASAPRIECQSGKEYPDGRPIATLMRRGYRSARQWRPLTTRA
jgi:heat shock protein HslJ